MRISTIEIECYRSIEKVTLEVGPFSVLVGQNNHGKTNVFEALQWFYNSKSTKEDEYHCKDTGKVVSVCVDFADVTEDDIEKLSTEATKTKIRNLLDGATSFSVKKTSGNHKRSYIVGDDDKGNPTGLDTAINEFIPRLEYVNTKIRLDDFAKYKDRNPIGQMLSGVLTTIVETSAEYQKFREEFTNLFEGDDSEVKAELRKLGDAVEVYLQKQFPDGTKVNFTVNPPQFTDLLKSFETAVDDGIETAAEAKGDGMQRAIMLAIIQAFADFRRSEQAGASFLFLIDEAELHLHPTAQRALKKALLDICETDQVLINTHSSVLVTDQDNRQKIFRVEKNARITSVEEIPEHGKADIVFELLGGSPADLLLPRNFLIVEGRSEFAFLTKIIERFYREDAQGIKIVFGGGDLTEQERSLLAVHKVLVPLVSPDQPVYKDRVIVLIDKQNGDQANKYVLFKEGYPYLFDEDRVKELPTHSLEEYYSGEFARTPAAFEQEGKTKVAYAREVANSITQEQFENEMPVVHAALNRCIETAFSA